MKWQRPQPKNNPRRKWRNKTLLPERVGKHIFDYVFEGLFEAQSVKKNVRQLLRDTFVSYPSSFPNFEALHTNEADGHLLLWGAVIEVAFSFLE